MIEGDFYGNKFKWFVGVVVSVVDNASVRVRIFGIHNMEDRDRLPNTDLPIALVLMPTTGGQVSSGHFGHDLSVDSWVFGFFADGDDCQQPIIMGPIQGGQYSMSSMSHNGGEFVGQPAIADASLPSNSPTPQVDTQSVQHIPGGSNVEKVYNFLHGKLTQIGDFDPHLHSSAAVGVIQLESTPSINPQIVNPSSGAYGICQWLSRNRVNDMRRVTGSSTPSFGQQLDFMWWELNNTETRAKKLWLQASNLPDAVAGFCMFERAEEVDSNTGALNRSHGNYKKRLQYAYGIYNAMKPAEPTNVTGTQLA